MPLRVLQHNRKPIDTYDPMCDATLLHNGEDNFLLPDDQKELLHDTA